MKVALQTDLTNGGTIHKDGDIVDLPEAEAQHLIDIGAASPSDGTPAVETPAPQAAQETTATSAEVDTNTAAPLPDSEVAGQPEQPVQQEASQNSTQEQPVSSSINLHLG